MRPFSDDFPDLFSRRRISRGAIGRERYAQLISQKPGLRFWFGPMVFYAGIAAIFFGLSEIGPAFDPVSILIYVGAFTAIGVLQFLLLHASHEAWHHHFGKRGVVGWGARILLAYPLGLSDRLRAEHLTHHSAFGSPEDPDRVVYAFRPASRLHLVSEIAVTLSGLRAVEQFLKRYDGETGEGPAEKETRGNKGVLREVFLIAAIQLMLLGVLTWTVGIWAYPIFWLAPLLCIVKTLAFLRGITEHGDPTGGAVLRTFRTREPVSRLILGSYGFWCHAEHHLLDQVPWYKVGEVARLLDAEPDPASGGIEIERVQGGHLTVLSAWWRILPWRQPMKASPANA